MQTPTTIVFDLDGTLIHSAPDLHASANIMLAGMGRGPVSLAQVISFIGNGVPVLVERCLNATGGLPDDGGAAALESYLAAYSKNLAVLTAPYPGVIAELDRIAARGIPMAVCTNKPQTPARDLCAELGIAPYFAAITGGDSFEVKKPDALPLLKTIESIGGTPETCLYVGDSETDYLTAKAGGVAFALFSGGYLHAPIQELEKKAVFDNWVSSNLSNWSVGKR